MTEIAILAQRDDEKKLKIKNNVFSKLGAVNEFF